MADTYLRATAVALEFAGVAETADRMGISWTVILMLSALFWLRASAVLTKGEALQRAREDHFELMVAIEQLHIEVDERFSRWQMIAAFGRESEQAGRRLVTDSNTAGGATRRPRSSVVPGDCLSVIVGDRLCAPDDACSSQRSGLGGAALNSLPPRPPAMTTPTRCNRSHGGRGISYQRAAEDSCG